jgi:GNAT superfamily N-acetyltransferase
VSDSAPAPRTLVRPIEPADLPQWTPLWQGYNAFYGRSGATSLAPAITHTSWQRFFDPGEPVFALVAEDQGKLVGIAHYLFHRSTTRIEQTCYLQDLYTDHTQRGRGIGRALIQGVYEQARTQGIKRVYWMTQASNTAGRLLYDKLAKHAGFIVYGQDL